MADERDQSPATIKEDLVAGKILLVDVREPTEFANERIRGAMNYPLSTFDPAAVPVGIGRRIVFQCGSGMRSRKALDQFLEAHPEVGEAAHLAGGISGWKAAGYSCIRIDPSNGRIADHGHL